MNTIFGVFVLVITANVSIVLADSCWAAPDVYGPPCWSFTAVFGSPGYRIRYSIRVQQGQVKTLVCCEGYSASTKSFLGIGCGYDSWSSYIYWGDYVDKPGVKCYGTPTGTTLTWNF